MGAATPARSPAHSPCDAPLRVLVVDDNADAAEGVCDILQFEGYEFAVANNGAGALRKAGEFSPDLALVDLRLGSDWGLDVVGALQANHENIITVIMTGESDASLVISALRSGVYDYLTKPFEPHHLLSVIERARDRIHLERARLGAEAQLRQAQKIEAVGQLTGGIAHDFNNLLTVIIGNLQLVESALKGTGKAERRAGEALKAAFKGAELTRQMLSFARKQPLAAGRHDINQMVKDVSGLLARSLGERITMRVEAGDEPAVCLVDPTQMETSLLNLAINARDAMDGAGELTIETGFDWLDDTRFSPAEAETARPGRYVRVSVRDTGSGIPAELIDDIFEPFFTTKEVGKGTGLGLSMVYGFIKQSGGHLEVDSKPGEGTTFHIFLPLVE